MSNPVSKYLSDIGRKGGLKSRRTLSSAKAAEMVQVREARRAFKRYYSTCFWSYRRDFKANAKDIPWVVEQLKKHGNRSAWETAAKLCR